MFFIEWGQKSFCPVSMLEFKGFISKGSLLWLSDFLLCFLLCFYLIRLKKYGTVQRWCVCDSSCCLWPLRLVVTKLLCGEKHFTILCKWGGESALSGVEAFTMKSTHSKDNSITPFTDTRFFFSFVSLLKRLIFYA